MTDLQLNIELQPWDARSHWSGSAGISAAAACSHQCEMEKMPTLCSHKDSSVQLLKEKSCLKAHLSLPCQDAAGCMVWRQCISHHLVLQPPIPMSDVVTPKPTGRAGEEGRGKQTSWEKIGAWQSCFFTLLILYYPKAAGVLCLSSGAGKC